MAFEQANHYVISGKGINAVVDTAGITGAPTVTLEVDGESVNPPTLRTTQHGIVVDGTGAAVPDSYTIQISLTFPEVNLSEEQVTFAGFATLTTALTSIGGPGLVAGASVFGPVPAALFAASTIKPLRWAGVPGRARTVNSVTSTSPATVAAT